MGKHYILEASDKAKILELYRKGIPMTKIARLTGYHHNTVRSVVKNETGYYTEVNPKFPKKDDEVVYTAKAHRKTEEELKKEVLALYEEGKSVDEIIIKTKALTRSEIEQILFDKGKIEDDTGKFVKAASVEDVREFASTVKRGDRFKISNGNYNTTYDDRYIVVTVQNTYKNLVATNKGYFNYADLFYGKKL